ncbi:MAG: hypothetical protein K2O03_15140, partial [Lachnospiraceae bacterium]|nr:hypothetical protein [Lachnospiraceae bacterium]
MAISTTANTLYGEIFFPRFSAIHVHTQIKKKPAKRMVRAEHKSKNTNSKLEGFITRKIYQLIAIRQKKRNAHFLYSSRDARLYSFCNPF